MSSLCMIHSQAAASSNTSIHVELGQACLDAANPVFLAVCNCSRHHCSVISCSSTEHVQDLLF